MLFIFIRNFWLIAYVDQDLTMIQVMVAAPKASPPIVRNKLNMIFSPFLRISDITVFLSYDSVMQTIAKPVPVPTTVDMISVATRAVKTNIFIFSFHRFFRSICFYHRFCAVVIQHQRTSASPAAIRGAENYTYLLIFVI